MLTKKLTINDEIISFRSTFQKDFKELHDRGTEGSVPGPQALKNQEELFGKNEGVPVSILFNNELFGIVTFVESSWKKYLTTSTYIAPGKHSIRLSSILKETAHKVSFEKYRKYVIFVSPDNEYAQMSMKNVWPMSDPEQTDDGTLAYVAHHDPHSWNEELAKLFNELFDK